MYRKNNRNNLLITIARILLGVTFVFSGFVKGADPWGTAIKLEEYFHAFSMEWLISAKYVLSVVLSSFEMLIGLLLLLNIGARVTSFLSGLFLAAMTILTLVLAITNPVSDCGCFGDAVKLTNWQTFFKNVVLVGLNAVLLVCIHRVRPPEKRSVGADSLVVLLLALLSATPGIYSLRHLPLMDFLPFKTGTDISKVIEVPEDESRGEYLTLLIYKNKQTGEKQEFSVDDTTWYDESKWEFIDSYTKEIRRADTPGVTGFSVFSPDGDVTRELLDMDGDMFLFVADDITTLSDAEISVISSTVDWGRSVGIHSVCVTYSPLDDETLSVRKKLDMPLFNMDATTLKMLIRAHKGLVLLNKGTVTGKWNIRDIPRFEEGKKSGSATGYVVSQQRRHNDMFMIAVLVVCVALIGAFRSAQSKKER